MVKNLGPGWWFRIGESIENPPKHSGFLELFPKDPFVCPKNPGLGPLHSYSFRMGLERSGFLGIRNFAHCFLFYFFGATQHGYLQFLVSESFPISDFFQ